MLAFILPVTGYTATAAWSVPAPLQSPDAERAIRQAAADAEIHAIGVNKPPSCGIEMDDVRDWKLLIDSLRTKKGAARRVYELLPEREQKALQDEAIVGRIGAKEEPKEVPKELVRFKFLLARALSTIVNNPEFYDESAFKDTPLERAQKDAIALGKKRSLVETLRLNRGLLAAALPGALVAPPDDFQTIRVKVKAGTAVILVLSSVEPCRWEVELDKGAKVSGVILLGYRPQEVRGVDVPVLNRVRYDAAGNIVNRDAVFYLSGREDDPEYRSFKPMEAVVEKLTGRGFTSTRGKNTSPAGGFIIIPGEK
jgi:hypothetical protein